MDFSYREPLLVLARRTIEAKLADGAYPPLPEVNLGQTTFAGAFVSLHNGRRLRGCVGCLESENTDIRGLVQNMAVSVLSDPRFSTQPVTLSEMRAILIELSLLSPMRRTTNPLELEPDVHGVYIRRGLHSGCFLPQVAAHMQWNREQMLSHCCSDKAGLPPDAWRNADTEVYLFTADVFAEPAR